MSSPNTNLFSQAARALALLNEAERKSVLRYLFVRDAKMSLASQLLKHYALNKCLKLPWSKTTITRNAKTKPVYVDPATGSSPMDFNVSHQAGLVALVAAYDYDGTVDIGCDVVCTTERADRDHGMIAREGWPAFVDMHADVFAPGEASYLKFEILSAIPGALPAVATPRQRDEFKLRCFYALWCLREAYVKMTGEALLAPWLKVLEFRGFRPPREDEDGGVIRVDNILFEGRKVEDANVSLRTWGEEYMTCTALRTPGEKEVGLGIELGPYEMVQVEDILNYAEANQ